MTTPTHSSGPVHARTFIGLGPKTAAVVGTSAAVYAAHALGQTWLAQPILHVPAGCWAVATAWVAGWAVSRGAFANLLPTMTEHDESSRAHELQQTSHADTAAPAAPASPASPAASVDVDVDAADDPDDHFTSTDASVLSRNSARVLRRAGKTVERIGRRARGRHTDISVGLDMPSADAAQIMLAAGDAAVAGVNVHFEHADRGQVKNGLDDSDEFDALVRLGPDGRLYLFVHAREDSPAAWHDWSEPAPLGYASVFPLRLDTCRARLDEVDLKRNDLALLTARLAIAAATLGRTPARLGGLKALGSKWSVANFTGAVSASVLALADALMSVKPEGAEHASGLCKSAARVVSAYIASSTDPMTPTDRLHLATTASAFLDHEPESMLRLGALRIASGQTEFGLAALVDAADQLRHGQAECALDPMPFIMAEANFAAESMDTRLAFGRLCAGVALMCSTAKPASVTYLRDDLFDDLRAAGWGMTRRSDLTILDMLMNQLGAATCRAADTSMTTTTKTPPANKQAA